MNLRSLRALLGLAVGLVSLKTAGAQAQLNVDLSNLSAVTFTATGANSLGNYSGTFGDDSITLVGFFTSDTQSSYTMGSPTGITTLGDHNGSGSGDLNFLVPSNSTVTGPFLNLAIFTLADPSPAADFSTSAPAFTGSATWDVSNSIRVGGDFSPDLLPGLGASGDIVFSGVVVGTWTVTAAASAVPEPSSIALLSGCAVLGLAAWRRKNRPVSRVS